MIEFSELQAVDFALGEHIAKAYRFLSRGAGPESWRRFLMRPSNRQIYRVEHETPRELLQTLWASRKEEKPGNAPGKVANLPELPLIAYGRAPGMSHDDPGAVMQGAGLNRAYIDGANDVYRLAIFPVELEYKLTFAAWDKPTLDKLQLAWYAFASNVKAGNNAFRIRYRIAGEQFEGVRTVIVDPRKMLFTNASPPQSSGRLFAAETTVQVSTQVIYGDQISPNRFINYRGPCVPGERYHVLDIVTVEISGRTFEFICIEEHTADEESCPPYNSAYWLLWWAPGSFPLNRRGECEDGVTYYVFDVVHHEGQDYMCIIEHTPNGDCPPNSAFWVLLPHWDDRWKWAPGVAYVIGNFVLWRDGCYYFATQNHIADESNAPPHPDHWMLFTCATQTLTVPVEVEINFDLIGYCDYRA